MGATTRRCQVLGVMVWLAACAAAAAEGTGPESFHDVLRQPRCVVGGPVGITTASETQTLTARGRISAAIVHPADAFLCRLTPQADDEVLQFSIGHVASSRCNALYSPSTDLGLEFSAAGLVLQRDGQHWSVAGESPLRVRVVHDVYRVGHQLKWFRPLDKSVFRRAPAGWCSWYIYWQAVTEDEVLQNTAWLAEHLKPFGLEYVQIDDGWQGVGHGNGENRDWFVTCAKQFPHGMKYLASAIKAKGLVPGIWLCPFGQSDEAAFKAHPDWFVRRADGTSAGEDPTSKEWPINWVGRYQVDPSGAAGQAYLRRLFTMLCPEWGYEYVKIDGQGGMTGMYTQHQATLVNPQVKADDAYRAGLAAIKSVMGPQRFLLNCAGAYDSAGYCEGIRTGGDVGPDWSGMQPAIAATLGQVYKNHIGWWTDPDVVCVRPPLTLDQARLWATLLGITGQLLMSSDKMDALPDERVELLRRIYPVADIRPMDLYPATRQARVFDLRVAKPGVGEWDVAAAFNWQADGDQRITLDPARLGLPGGRYSFYDVWAKQLLGVQSTPLTLTLAPMSCRVLAIRAQGETPQLVGSSRHLTQGADDLLAAAWDAGTPAWRGTSQMVGGDPYELRFTLPPGWTANGEGVVTRGPLAVLTIKPAQSGTVRWGLRFQRSDAAAPGVAVTDGKLETDGPRANLSWTGQGAVAWRVYRNGTLLAQTVETRFSDDPRPRRQAYEYEVAALRWGGTESPRVALGRWEAPPLARGHASDAWLETLAPLSATQDWGALNRGKSAEGNPLRIDGVAYEHGLGTHANAEQVYRLANRYRRLEAQVGVDDEKRQSPASVVFQVWADGEKVWDSGVVRAGEKARPVSVDLDGVDLLRLVLTDGGDGINSDHADWAMARLLGNP